MCECSVELCNFSDGQNCFNNTNVNRRGQQFINNGRQVIVPRAAFNCNGRITRIAVSMQLNDQSGNLPIFQVWHPTSNTSSTYSRIGEVQLPLGDLVNSSEGDYHYVNMSLNSNSQIEFQSGDVIGYYQPSDPQGRIWSIQTNGYTSYSNNATNGLSSFDTSNVNHIDNDYQPLIAVIIGKIIQICMATDYNYGNYLKFICILYLASYRIAS